MIHFIPVKNKMVVQKAQGGISPRLQLDLMREGGPQAVLAYRRKLERDADDAWCQVTEEIMEARFEDINVNVIKDENKPDRYMWIEISD